MKIGNIGGITAKKQPLLLAGVKDSILKQLVMATYQYLKVALRIPDF